MPLLFVAYGTDIVSHILIYGYKLRNFMVSLLDVSSVCVYNKIMAGNFFLAGYGMPYAAIHNLIL